MITVMVADIINSTDEKDGIKLSAKVNKAMNEFREFMFAAIYKSKLLEDERRKAKYVIHKLYEYYLANPGALPEEFLAREEFWGLQSTVTDYIAGLSDSYAIALFEKLFIPPRGFQIK